MEAEIVSMCLSLFNGPNGAGTSQWSNSRIVSMLTKKLLQEALNQS